MNGKAAICEAFLKGHTLSIKSAFNLFGISNLPRECSRQVEKPFGVTIHRERKEGKTKYGIHCTWFEYKLKRTEENKHGIDKMIEYVKSQQGYAKTTEQKLSFKQLDLL